MHLRRRNVVPLRLVIVEVHPAARRCSMPDDRAQRWNAVLDATLGRALPIRTDPRSLRERARESALHGRRMALGAELLHRVNRQPHKLSTIWHVGASFAMRFRSGPARRARGSSIRRRFGNDAIASGIFGVT